MAKTKNKKQKLKKERGNKSSESTLEKSTLRDQYKRSLWTTLTKSKTMRVYNANKTVANNRNMSMLNKAKIKQGILSAASLHLQHAGNKLEFEVKDVTQLPATLEVLADLSSRYNIQHGTNDPSVPVDKRDRVIILSLKEVDVFGVM